MSAPLLVADSGPLIALARVSLLHLPASLYGLVLVPSAVREEVMRRPSEVDLAGLQAAFASSRLNLAPDAGETSPSPLPDPALGAGERAAITMAQARGAEVLIDERRGRRTALDVDLQVVGTLGLLVRGRELRLIGPIRPPIAALRVSGYHLGDSLTTRVLESLGE